MKIARKFKIIHNLGDSAFNRIVSYRLSIIGRKNLLLFQFCILIKLDVMKKRDAFVLAGFKRNNLAEIVITTGMQTCHSYGKPVKVKRNLPDLVVRATRDHNRNAESAR